MSGSRYIAVASGSAARTARSAASMVAATSAAELVALTPILAATSSSSGPRCRVFMWMTRSTPGVAVSAATTALLRLGARGLAEQEALGLDREDHRDR